MSPPLTRAERKALSHAVSIWRRMRWYVTTNRSVRKATVDRLVARGLLKELEQAVVRCDGDGWPIEPERFRVGYGLTAAGWQIAEQFEREEAA